MVCWHALTPDAIADAVDRANWATGAALRERLAEPVDVLWSGNPLRSAIDNLSKAQRVAILIDRRVDPGQKLDLTVKGQSLETALWMIASHCGLGVARLGDVVYLGPRPVAVRLHPLATALDRAVRRLPPLAQQKFHRTKAMAWPDLSSPRDLLSRLAEQDGLEIVALEKVPHDLWAAADLPPLSLADRLTLIAAEFDLTFKVLSDGTRLELVPIPQHLPIAPDGLGSRPTSPPTPAGQSAATEDIRINRLSVENKPLGPVLRQLAVRLGLELRMDERAMTAAGVSLDRRVSVKVENATVDELLDQLLTPAGLSFQRRQNVVDVRPAKPRP